MPRRKSTSSRPPEARSESDPQNVVEYPTPPGSTGPICATRGPVDRDILIDVLRRHGVVRPEVVVEVALAPRSSLDGARAEYTLSDGTGVTSVTIDGSGRGQTSSTFTAYHQERDYALESDRLAFLHWNSLPSELDALLLPLGLSGRDYVRAVDALRQATWFRRPPWYSKVLKVARQEGAALHEVWRSLRQAAALCGRLCLPSAGELKTKAVEFAARYRLPSEVEDELRSQVEPQTAIMPTTGEIIEFTRTGLDVFEIHYRKEAGSAFLSAFKTGVAPSSSPHVNERLVTDGIVALIRLLLDCRLSEKSSFKRAADLLHAAGSRPVNAWSSVRWTKDSVRSRYK